MNVDDTIRELATVVIDRLTSAGLTVATAESCTGGWIAKALTDIPGSSACFGYGIVSYSNQAKAQVLGVSTTTLSGEGAVSEAAVREMAAGALALSGANLAVAVSGIAGPDGGTSEKPVGTVWFAWAMKEGGVLATDAERHSYSGSRETVRARSVVTALEGLRNRIGGH